MNIVIIEDEIETALNLERLIKKLRPEAKLICRLESVEKALDYFGNQQLPDLVFMDIELSDGSCFEIFEEINLATPIIFTTAYDKFLAKSFIVNNLNYLVKPIGTKALEESLLKYERLYQQKPYTEINFIDEQTAAERHIFVKNKTRFLVRYGTKMVVLSAPDIDFITKEEVVLLISNGKKYISNYSLDELASRLDPFQFFRINRQTIINIRIVTSIESYFGGRLFINHCSSIHNQELIVSQRRNSEFRSWLDSDLN